MMSADTEAAAEVKGDDTNGSDCAAADLRGAAAS